MSTDVPDGSETTLEEAKNDLRSRFEEVGCVVEEDGEDGFVVQIHGQAFGIDAEELQDHAQRMRRLATAEATPWPSSLSTSDHSETLIEDMRRFRGVAFHRPFEGGAYAFEDPQTERPVVRIATPSRDWLVYHLRQPYVQQHLQYAIRSWRMSEREEARRPRFRELACRNLFTVQVEGLRCQSAAAAAEAAEPLVQACLFQLAYLHNAPFRVLEGWSEDTSRRARDFRRRPRPPDESMALPAGRFNPDTVRFYKRALAAADPVTKFLSFYHVLEYHFVEVDDEALRQRLMGRMCDP